MRLRPLCKDIRVSEISFGGVEIGVPYGVHKELMSEEAAIKLLHAAVEAGVTFFDTARMYGCSEERMGKAFKGMRSKVVICSKCGHLRDEEKKIRTGKALKDYVDRCLGESLKMLQTDYIDAYLVHSADREILERDEVAELLGRYVEKGDVRSVGVSTYGAADAKLAIEDGRWNVIQLAFNLMDQSCGELFGQARKRDVGIMVRSVLMRGILTEPGIDLTHEKLRPVFEHRKRYLELLGNGVRSLSDLATKFVLSYEDVSSVLVGIDKVEFLEKAVELANSGPLSRDVFEEAKRLAYPEPAFLDIANWDRQGWTK